MGEKHFLFQIREQKSIEGGILGDCVAVWCCLPCVLCQAAKEMNVDLMAGDGDIEQLERV